MLKYIKDYKYRAAESSAPEVSNNDSHVVFF